MQTVTIDNLPLAPVVITDHGRQQLHARIPNHVRARVLNGDIEMYAINAIKWSVPIGKPRLEFDGGQQSVTYFVTDGQMVYSLRKLLNVESPVYLTTVMRHSWFHKGRR